VARASPPKPIIIAHRGASGYLPEHTLASKALAYGMGADFLEQDVVASADGEAIVFHDLVLDHTTDVHSCFPGRARSDGLAYVIDFSLAELRQLRVTERRASGDPGRARWPGRFPLGVGHFSIATLAEELRFISELNRSTGGHVGAYIEIKKPAWHHEQGVDLSRLVMACLEDSGFRNAADRVYLQCFDFAELKRLRVEFGTSLPLIQLLRGPGIRESDFDHLCSPEGLAELARVVQGIGPGYGQLVSIGPGKDQWLPTPLFSVARQLGLLIHAYTFRADQLPDGAPSFDQLLEFFLHRLKVDGVFCDFPDRAVRIRDGSWPDS
jgi:glycerophosphoryl diester phosphodiesterase